MTIAALLAWLWSGFASIITFIGAIEVTTVIFLFGVIPALACVWMPVWDAIRDYRSTK